LPEQHFECMFQGMTLTAKVQNHSIPLPPELRIEDGTEVSVVLPEKISTAANRHGWMLKFAGAAKDLPEDFAAEHDHYIHGIPKRASS